MDLTKTTWWLKLREVEIFCEIGGILGFITLCGFVWHGFFHREFLSLRCGDLNKYQSYPLLNQHSGGISTFSIGNTSSIRVHWSLSLWVLFKIPSRQCSIVICVRENTPHLNHYCLNHKMKQPIHLHGPGFQKQQISKSSLGWCWKLNVVAQTFRATSRLLSLRARFADNAKTRWSPSTDGVDEEMPSFLAFTPRLMSFATILVRTRVADLNADTYLEGMIRMWGLAALSRANSETSMTCPVWHASRFAISSFMFHIKWHQSAVIDNAIWFPNQNLSTSQLHFC